MKQCPKCQRTYADDNQKFCTVDGGRLESAAATAETTYDLSPTVITNQADLNVPPDEPAVDLNKTMAALPPPPTGEIRSGDTGPATNRTIAASFQPADFPSPQAPPQPPQQQPPPQPYRPAQQDYRQPQQPPPFQQQQQQPPAYQQQQPQQQYQQQQYQPQPQQSAQTPHASAPVPHQTGHAPHAGASAATAPRKGSRLPLMLGALVLLLLIGGGAAYYFLVLNKKDGSTPNANNANGAGANTNANANASANTNANANTTANANTAPPPYEPPPNTTEFVNSSAKLDGKLAEHFTAFSFYYPNSWQLDPKSGVAGASNFVVVERKLPPDFTQERFAVGWYESNGTYEADKSLFPNLVQASSTRLEKLPGYEKLSEGPTKVNSMNAYEFRFSGLSEGTEKGDVNYWGRIIFLPPGVEGHKNGLTLTILTSSLAPELEGIDDVGVKGELPVILESFRLK
jgi:hypothetical protein